MMESDRRKNRQALYNTKRWKETRDYMRQLHPLCQDCESQGKIVPMEEVHHVKSPFVRGISSEEKEKRSFDVNNLVCLCKECHIKRHHPEGFVSMRDLIKKYS